VNTIKKFLVTVALIVTVALATIAIAQTLYTLYFSNTGTIITPELKAYLDGTPLANGTTIDWEECEPGYTYYFKNFTIVNTGDTTLTVILEPVGLPGGWQLQWQGNNTTLAPSEKAGGWLNLTIPSDATSWPSWGFYIKGEGA